MKQMSPSAARNRDPILEVLRCILPQDGMVLEIASGSGEHAVHFAARLPEVRWQLTNVQPAKSLDVLAEDWGFCGGQVDALVCINMIHIAPWACCEALFRGASSLLPDNAPIVLYGPYRFDGKVIAASNENFDDFLKSRNPQWGLREVSDIQRVAKEADFGAPEVIPLPANNHILVFRRIAHA